MPGRGQRSAPLGGVGGAPPAPALETLANAAGAMEVGVEALPVAPAAPVPSPEGPGVPPGLPVQVDGEVEPPPGQQTPDQMQDAAWKAKLEAARGIKPGCVKYVLTGWSGPDKPTRAHLNAAITERLREGEKRAGATIAVQKLFKKSYYSFLLLLASLTN